MASPAQMLTELLEAVKRIEEHQLKQEQRLNAIARQITLLGKVLLAPPETPGARGRPKLTRRDAIQAELDRRRALIESGVCPAEPCPPGTTPNSETLPAPTPERYRSL